MPTPTHIVWLVANEPEVSRVGPGHTNIPRENRFSLHLRKELLKADILTVLGIGTKVHSAEQLCSRSCTKELHSVFLPFHNQVVGIMLVKAADSFNIFSCLSSAQRCVSEYWTATMHSEHPLLFLQCVAAARLEQPFSVRSTKQSAAAKMFFRCTSFSSENLLQEKVAGAPGATVADVIKQCCNFRLILPSEPTLCLVVPAAHAFLLAHRAWSSYGIPVPATGKSRAALGLAHVSDLIRQAMKATDEEGLLEECMSHSRTDNLLQSTVLQDIADFLRRAAQSLPDMKAEAVAHITLLQSTADSIVQEAQASSRHAFAVKHLVHALIVSGHLHSSADMLPLLRAALHTILRVPELVKALDADLRRPHKVPSPSCLYRHRLTVHIGLCRWVQDRDVFEVYMDKQGFCRWATLDSSPQGAWDWMLSGSTAVGLSKLQVCFHKANALIRLGNQTCSDETATETNLCQQHLVAKELAQHLCMRQLTPTALGSGRSSLVHKVHAIAHSTRLSAADWRYTCCMMNETLTWTGDLGVESGMPGFKGNVCRLFGDWALQEAFPQDYEGARANQEEQESEFDFALPALAAQVNSISRLQRLKEFNLDFSRSLYIAGPLHIMHKLTEGLDRAMSWWKEFVSRMTHVCRLLGHKWNRARLIATCFVDAPWNAFVELYQSFGGAVYQGRWGAVLHAVTELLPLEASLRGAWCKAKFGFNAQGAREGRDVSGSSKGLDLDVVDEAIQSTRFWAYVHMIKHIGETIEHIMFWCESCPCHGHDAKNDTLHGSIELRPPR
eukprot:s3556_g9.t1